MERFLTFLGYAWRISVNVLALAVVLYVFTRLQDRLEFIIVSILGLIFGTIRTIVITQAMAFGQFAMGLARDIHHIKWLLGEEQDGGFDEAEKTIRRHAANGYIELVFISIVWIVCLYNLFSTI